MIRVLYVCSFPLGGHSGHKRATRHKLEALAGVADLEIISSRFNNRFLRILEIPILEFRAIVSILVRRPCVVISRGSIGFAFQWLAVRTGVLTVREVHANASEEVALQGRGVLLRQVLRLIALISERSDIFSDMRIFNNPALMRWFHETHFEREYDVAVYNGYHPESALDLDRDIARDDLGLDVDSTYLAFTGSASEWHGVEYLVSLQREFDRAGDQIKIVCGGGPVSADLDPDRRLVNITPLDDVGCAKLIRAADLSLLPVKLSRVSPGSPLKLYDYIVNGSWVVTQADVEGYSDEVTRYGVGISVDFRDSTESRLKIIDALSFLSSGPIYPEADASWHSRMLEWLDAVDRISLCRNTAV